MSLAQWHVTKITVMVTDLNTESTIFTCYYAMKWQVN